MGLGWVAILRLGLVQACIGAVVVLTTSTFNRLMVVELSLPAVLPGLLVALHYGVQITRPNWGFLSDAGGNRTRFILGGMAALALGGFGAALGVMVTQHHYAAGIALSVLAYALIGLGVGASGTSLLALLAAATDPRRRAAAATITWLMMIAGIALTAGTVGATLDPYSPARLLRITAIVTAGALALTALAVRGIERRATLRTPPQPKARFRDGLAEVWADPTARRFTIFVFLSMVAYFMQELIMEPYAGLVFGFTPGQSTALSGAQHGGVFLGMLTVGVAATGLQIGSLRSWTVAGCVGSALSLALIAALGLAGLGPMLMAGVMSLGFFNGMFAVSAIGSMMALAGAGRGARAGTRMGLWGGAQAIAAGFGGLLGAASADLMRLVWPSGATAFAVVFVVEAALFASAAMMALRLMGASAAGRAATAVAGE